MKFPTELKYTKDHEWTRIEANTVTVGITDHAQNALGDVVYAELPSVGRTLRSGETFGVIESIKAVSDLYSPVAGKVIAINQEVTDDPSLVNKDPYGRAWMLKMELSDLSSLDSLMDSAAYEKFVATSK